MAAGVEVRLNRWAVTSARLDIQPDLFGAWCFIREWGREGRSGQVRQVPYPTPDEAQAALDRQCRAKERRGYAANEL